MGGIVTERVSLIELTKTEAETMFNKGKVIIFTHFPFDYFEHRFSDWSGETFDNLCKSFVQYNCTGDNKTIKFYIEEEEK